MPSQGSSFHKFKGLKAPQKVYSATPYSGLPCIHSKHGDTEVFRDGHSHACLACIDDIEHSQLGFNLDRLKPEYHKIAHHFWSKVDIGSLDDCWQWLAPNLHKMGVSFHWRRPPIRKVFKFHAVHVSNWLTWGDIGRHEVMSLCGQRRCVNPLHQIPVTGLGVSIVDNIVMTAAATDLELLKQQLTLKSPKFQIPKSLDEQMLDDWNATPFLSKYRSLNEGFVDAYELALMERDQRLFDTVTHLT